MSESDRALFNAALSLPPASRAELAELLWASLPDQPVDTEVSNDVRAAWAEEAKRRMKEVDDGKVDVIPGEVVMARLRQRMPS
jgi:putative addiction module component (TIGR02574 family)